MVKTLKGLALIGTIILAMGVAGSIETTYTMKAEVVESSATLATLKDTTGNLWEVYNLQDDNCLTVGQKVKVTFHSNFTDSTREDDIIEKVRVIK